MSTSSACYTSFWTKEENKAFENALAIYGNVDKWENIAAAVPGKTLEDIKKHYRTLVDDVLAIEAGLVPLPNYVSSSHNSSNFAGGVSIKTGGNQTGHEQSDLGREKRLVGTIVERKRGRPWTEEEHRQFLEGLEKYGKGDWRSISRLHVVSRTPTQVASHAQKYFKRLESDNRRKRSSIHDITSVDNGTASDGQRPVDGEKSEVAQVETMGDASASQRPLITGQMSGAGGIEYTSNETSEELPVSTQTIGVAGVEFTGGTSILQMPLTAQPTGVAALGPIDNTDGIEFTGNRASQQLPISAQTIGLIGGTSIPRMPLSAQSTGAAALCPIDYIDGIELTGNIASQQLPVSGQMSGIDFAGATSIPQMPLIAHPTRAGAVGPINYTDDIFAFTSNIASRQLPVSAQMIEPAGVDFARGTSIRQMPLSVQKTGAAAVGPIDYTNDIVDFTSNRASQQLPVSLEMIGLAGVDFVGGTSIPRMPFTARSTGVALVGPIDYTESLVSSSIAGVSMVFPRTPSLPMQRPVTSTIGMPVSLPYPTSMMYGVMQTPYGLFIPHPPLNAAPMTYPTRPPSDQNR